MSTNAVARCRAGNGLVVGRAGRCHQALRMIEIVACFTRSADKRHAFAAKYGCRAAAELRGDPARTTRSTAVINTTPNNVHLETTRMAAQAGKHVFLDKPIANTVAEGAPDRARCARRPASCWRSAISAAARAISAGSRPRSMPAASASWCRPKATSAATGSASSTSPPGAIQAAGMPGGVMLQIGIHYVDVLEMLMGPVKRVSGMSAQLVLPGRQSRRRQPDPASTRTARSPTSPRPMPRRPSIYMMNIYGKEASAYYDLFSGLRHLKRGETSGAAGRDREERHDPRGARGVRPLRARAAASRRRTASGRRATSRSSRRACKSAREGRAVEVAEIMASGE